MSFRDLLTPSRQLQAEIRAARKAGAPWHELVRLLDRALDSANDADEQAALASAAEDAGISHVMWRRYRAALARTESIASEAGTAPERLLSDAFASQEIALRIHDRAPTEGLDILSSTAAGDLRLAELRDRLSRLSSPGPDGGEAARAAVVRAKGARRSLIDRVLKGSTAQLWGAGTRIARRPRLRYMSSDGYEVVAPDGSIAAGIDVIDVGVATNRDRVAENLSPSLLTSTLFPTFSLACLAAPGGTAERAAEVLDWLDVGWIGVVAVRDDGSVETVRRASGPPVPDRTTRYEAAKRRFGTRPERADAES